jgi:hypothetical protein
VIDEQILETGADGRVVFDDKETGLGVHVTAKGSKAPCRRHVKSM